jgi:hypothetical protein
MSIPTGYQPRSAEDFLMGGGTTSASFEQLGDTITGTIDRRPEVRQATDIATREPLFWPDGKPREQLVIVLRTNLKSGDPDDDGRRSLYVKGSTVQGSRSIHDAIRTAVQAAGASGLEVGGTLSVTWDSTEPSQTRGFNDRKLYSATYKAPSSEAANSYLGLNTGRDAQAARTATASSSAVSVSPSAGPRPVEASEARAEAVEASPADRAKQLHALGLDVEQIGSTLHLDSSIVSMLLQA